MAAPLQGRADADRLLGQILEKSEGVFLSVCLRSVCWAKTSLSRPAVRSSVTDDSEEKADGFPGYRVRLLLVFLGSLRPQHQRVLGDLGDLFLGEREREIFAAGP